MNIFDFFQKHKRMVKIASFTAIFLGFVLMSWLFLSLLVAFYNASKKVPLTRGFFWGLAAFLFQAMGSSHLMNSFRVAMIVWIYLGLGLALVRQVDSKSNARSRGDRFVI